jgi:hypothetical protein
MSMKARISRRCRLLYTLAVTAAALLLFEAVSGLVLWLALPHGQGGGTGSGLGRGAREFGSGVERTFAGIDRSLWVTTHDWAAVAFVVVVVLHVALHWKWVVRQTRAVLGGGRPAVQQTARCVD